MIKFLTRIVKQLDTDHQTAKLSCFCFFSQTASHVKARHELLEGAIGVFPEEKQAYEKILMLSWILPLTAIIGSLMDTILVVVFMKLAHPWKDILFGQMEQTEKTQPIESTDIQDMQSSNQVIFSPFQYLKESNHNCSKFKSETCCKFMMHKTVSHLPSNHIQNC